MNGHRLLITGAAGYVGGMLVEQFSARPDVMTIVALDKEPMPEMFRGNSKVVWIHENTTETGWEEKAREYQPGIVIHTAWQIRELYGNRDREWRWNIDGSDRVFDFAFREPSVKRLIHFSTVASYGSFPENSLEHRFTEEEPFRKSDYLYAEEKRICEEHLAQKYATAKGAGRVPYVAIVRPVAITGPRGRHMRVRFGLQAALSGTLKVEKSFWYSLVSLLVSFVPVTSKWLRQYIHEDDVNDIVELLSFGKVNESSYDVFNIAPPGECVLGKDMAKAVGKRSISVAPWMVRVAFFFFWHVTRGRIPTARGSWRGYSYPIAVSGEKLTRTYNYRYKWPSKEAFTKLEGRYAERVKTARPS